MKKMKLTAVASAAVSAALMLSACGVAGSLTPPEPKLTGGYKTEVEAVTRIIPPGENADKECEFAFGGSLRRYGAGFYELDITSPESLSGMRITVSDGEFTASLGELSFDMQGEDIPKSSPVRAMVGALESMALSFENGAGLSAGQDGGWVYQSDGLSAVFDSEGVIISLACSQPEMTAKFSGFSRETAPAAAEK